jgi:hypothetical protein
VFLIEPLWAPHHATGLEIARQHVDAGDHVHLVTCPTSMRACVINPRHRGYTCSLCRDTLRAGVDTLRLPRERVHEIPAVVVSEPASLPRDVGELVDTTSNGIPVGRGAASTLISLLRESEPEMGPNAELTRALLATAHLTASATTSLLDAVDPELVYLFNGRYAESVPILAVCQQRGIRIWTHDLGYEANTFRIVPDASVHALGWAKHLMHELWERGAHDEARRRDVAASYFEGRRHGGAGDVADRYRFIKGQRVGDLPPAMHEPGVEHRVGIFVSSEDELTTLDEYRNPVYRDQLDGLDAIVEHPWPTSTHLFVRTHPNLRGLHNSQTQRLSNLDARPNVTLISADSPIDSYRLMESCDVVVTFGSSVGIEAPYWGTQSVLVGRAQWEDLGVRRPATHAEVVDEIGRPRPVIADPLPYGYLQRTWGIPFRQYAPWPEDDQGGRVRVAPSPVALAKWRVRRFLDPNGGIVGRLVGPANRQPEDVPMPEPGDQG